MKSPDPKEETKFLKQLGATIQIWLGIEHQIYVIYAGLMKGADKGAVSVTFHHIQSFDSRITMVDKCLKIRLDKEKDKELLKKWGNIKNRTDKLNKQRNEIVHNQLIYAHKTRELFIHPSIYDASFDAKGTPASAQKYSYDRLIETETKFAKMVLELREFTQSLAAAIAK